MSSVLDLEWVVLACRENIGRPAYLPNVELGEEDNERKGMEGMGREPKSLPSPLPSPNVELGEVEKHFIGLNTKLPYSHVDWCFSSRRVGNL